MMNNMKNASASDSGGMMMGSKNHNMQGSGHAATFHFSFEIPVYLFENWTIDTSTDFIFALLFALILSLSLEILKRLQQSWQNKLNIYNQELRQVQRQQTKTNYLMSDQNQDPTNRPFRTFKNLSLDLVDRWTTEESKSTDGTTSARTLHRKRIAVHLLLSVLNCIKLVVGYLLMLSIMTFNAWMFICVVTTAAVGYFFLETRSKYVKTESPTISTSAPTDNNVGEAVPMGTASSEALSSETVPLQTIRTSISTDV